MRNICARRKRHCLERVSIPNMENKYSHIQKIVDLYVIGKYPQQVRNAMLRWLANPNHAQQKDQALKQLFDKTDAPPNDETYLSLKKVRAKLGMPESAVVHISLRKTIKNLRRTILRVAAVLIPLIVAAIFIIPNSRIGETEQVTVVLPQMIEFSHPATAIADEEIILADGSTIYLKPGGTVTYAADFEDIREVELTGAASFEVVRTEGNTPFVVKTKYLNTTVLGTRFTVVAYSDAMYTEVALDSGKLLVDVSGSSSAGTMMEPGDILTYDNVTGERSIAKTLNDMATAAPETPTAEKAKAGTIAGKAAPMVIVGKSLREIFREMESYYSIKVDVDASLNSEEKFDITFTEGDDIEDVMWILSELTGHWTYSANGDKITIIDVRQ